jgi:NAD(P)-dependent dehydrogenase (short-subunit alcohol dehydrogenase family)
MSARRAAIVTGAGSGIGRAIATRLADEGLAVAVLDLDHEAADRVTAELSERGLEAYACGGVDVSDRSQVDAAVERVRTEVGPPLVLVNNAGITGFKKFVDITDEKWDRIMEVNLNGPFYCTQAVVPDMVEAGWGRIVNISSSSAQSGQQYMVHYVTSKAGLIGFTKALAREIGSRNVTVNVVAPGYITTAMTDVLPEKSRQELESVIALRRLGSVDDVAAAVLYLASDEAAYVTGHVLNVSGGMYM